MIKILGVLFWYLIFSFIFNELDLLEWHMFGKIIFVIIVIIIVGDDD
jgi:hypothetical protein